ncbi:MAG: hypothetical protein COB35_09105 [Gammaproteobacteria bacterium]|nr:MAG: hypothetical protein COB35_09105 [Gammaproteobacteria bacterium]
MKIKLLNIVLVVLVSSFVSMAHAGLIVTFSGNVNNFNPGPFENTADYSGSFTLDDTITPTGANNNFTGAVINFTLDVIETTGTTTFTGTGGKLQQFSSGSGATDFITIALGGTNGSVTGSTSFKYIDTKTGLLTTSLFTLKTIKFDLRGSSLFGSPLIVASNLNTSDFSYRRFVMDFIRPKTGVPIGNWSSINTLGAVSFANNKLSQVPEPATFIIFGLGLMGLALCRVKNCNNTLATIN